MPVGGGAATDPGLHGDEPGEDALAAEDRARGQTSVADLVERDLDDPTTPSRRGADGDPEPGSFDVPLEDYPGRPTDAG